MINMIAAIGKNNELGKNNDLLWHLPGDLKYFKKVTSGKTVVMGRKTYESIGRLLPNRKNVILMLPNEEKVEGAIIYNDIPSIIKDFQNEEIFIIGGGSIYRQFIPYAKTLYLTEIQEEDKEATVYFPEFNKEEFNKEIISTEEENNIKYQFVKYERK